MKKSFSKPEVMAVELSSVEAVMTSFVAQKNSGIVYTITDTERDENAKQKYWADK